MNTEVKNFSLVEGSRSRMIVHLDESLDANSIEIYAGNDKCKCKQLTYHVVSKTDHMITLLSDPAPSNVSLIPYQIFIKDTTSNVEWLVVSGNISVLTRYVGEAGDSTIEINPPLEDEVIDIDVEVTFTKADLDEAVRQAREAAQCSYNWSLAAESYKAGACNYATQAEVYSLSAQAASADAGSSAQLALGFAGQAESAKVDAQSFALNASASKALAEEFATCASNYSHTACGYAENANYAASSAQRFAQDASDYAKCASCYLNEITGIAATKQDKLTWDSKPKSGSTNPVQSDGIYKCLSTREKTLIAGTNISLSRLGNSTLINASGGDVTSYRDNCFYGINTFHNPVYFNENNCSSCSCSCSCSCYAQPAININEGGRISWGGAEISGDNSGGGNVETYGTDFCYSTVCGLQLKLGSYWTSRAGDKISGIAIKAAGYECMENIAIEVSKNYDFQCSTHSLEASIIPCEWTNWQLYSPIDNDGSPLYIRRFYNCGDYDEIPWVGNYQCIEVCDDSGYYNMCSGCNVCDRSLPKLRILGGTGGNINVNGSLKVNGFVNIGDNSTSYLLNVNGRPFTQPKPMVPVNGVPSDNVLLNATTYITESCGADLSALSVEPYGTSELWIDNKSDVATSLPSWLWLDSEDKTASPITNWVDGYRYAIAVRNDGLKTLANIRYCYDRNN